MLNTFDINSTSGQASSLIGGQAAMLDSAACMDIIGKLTSIDTNCNSFACFKSENLIDSSRSPIVFSNVTIASASWL